MPEFKFIESTDNILKEFRFLVEDYGYSIMFQKKENDGFRIIYGKDETKVDLYYEYRDDMFCFHLIRGKNTKWPNDHDFENIKPFFKLFKKFEPDLDIKKLEPDKTQYLDALKLNAALLKKYGDKVLKGKEWI